MRKILIVLCFLFSACTIKPSYIYKGIQVYDQQEAEYKASVEDQKKLLDFAVPVGYEKYLKDWKLIFTNNWVALEKDEGLSVGDGLSSMEAKVMYITVHKCLWDSSIFHEFVHVLLYGDYGDSDVEHTNSIWGNVMVLENVMIRLNCPKDYKRSEPPNKIIYKDK